MSRTQPKLIRAILFLSVATLLLASVIVIARVKDERESPGWSESATAVPVRGPVQIVRFTLYDVGIYPDKARARSGPVTIVIEDLSGSSSGLIVERIEGDVRVAVGIVNRVANRLRTRAELPLPAGRYELSDASRRSNRASLLVEP